MPTRNVNLTDRFDQFVSEQVESGKYKNASEVMRAGLRLLEKQEQREVQRREVLRKLAAEAFAELDQGQGVTLNGDKELSDYLERLGRRAEKIVERRVARRAAKPAPSTARK